jgi:hypothetical protein
MWWRQMNGVNTTDRVDTKPLDSLIDTTKDYAFLIVAIPTICISLLSTDNPTTITVLLAIASVIIGSVFVLFKIASLKGHPFGIYARARALTATLIVLLSWIVVSSLLFLMLYLWETTSVSSLYLASIFGLSTGVLVGLVVLIVERSGIQLRFLKKTGLNFFENESSKRYPWKFPWPTNYLHAGLISYASIFALFSTGSLIPTESQHYYLIAGFSTLISLLFILSVQTYLEPVQYTSGLGDLFFGLATSGAILALTLTYVGVLITIISTFLLIFTRQSQTIDVEKISQELHEEQYQKNAIQEQFHKDHNLFWSVTSVMILSCFAVAIIGGIILFLLGNSIVFYTGLLSLIEVEFVRYIVKWWYIRKRKT